jgi:hypothetical protein
MRTFALTCARSRTTATWTTTRRVSAPRDQPAQYQRHRCQNLAQLGLAETSAIWPLCWLWRIGQHRRRPAPRRSLGALRALGHSRVLPPRDGQHRLGRQQASVGDADGVRLAEPEPAHPAVEAVDDIPGPRPRPDPQCEARLLRVPEEERLGGRPQPLDRELAELALAGQVAGQLDPPRAKAWLRRRA